MKVGEGLRRVGLSIVISSSACGDDVGEAIRPTASENTPAPDCVSVVVDELFPELPGLITVGHVLADDFAATGDEPSGAWALNVEGDDARLVLRRVRAPGEADIGPIPLTADIDALSEFALHRGEVPGVAYLFRDGPTASTIRRLEAGLGVTEANTNLRAFPPAPGTNPEDWTRRLLVLSGSPHLLAVPKHPGQQALTFELAAFEDDLSAEEGWTLTFGEGCDVEQNPDCALIDVRINVGGVSFFPGNEVGAVVLERPVLFKAPPNEDPDSAVELSDLLLLRLRMTPAGPTALLLTLQSAFINDSPFAEDPRLQIDPLDVAQDPWATVFYAVDRVEDQPRLFYFNTIEDQVLEYLAPPHASDARLVQLPLETALVEAEGDQLIATKVGTETLESVVVHELEGMAPNLDFGAAPVAPAGPDHLLLRRQDGPPQLVRMVCAD